jgi:hypothetical protein
MNRLITFEEFCRRCEKQGVSQLMFSELHPTEEIRRYCQVTDAENQWHTMKQSLAAGVARIHELEQLLTSGTNADDGESFRSELWQLYRSTFNAFKIKGIVEGGLAHGNSRARSLSSVA